MARKLALDPWGIDVKYSVEPRGRVHVVHIEGPQATLRNGADRFRDALQEMIEAGHRYLVIDFTGVVFADSTMLQALVSAYKRLEHGAGDLVVCALSSTVATSLGLTGIDRLVRTYGDVDAAAASLS